MSPRREDGVRILIDRLWPRGLSKAALKLDAWPRALAPSTELRKWYGHDPALFAEFRRRYRDELAAHKDELAALRAMIKGRTATLLTATRELDLSHAVVLREMLGRRLAEFLPRQRRALAERLQLLLGDVAAHRRHAAIGAGDDFFLRHVVHRLFDHGGDLFRRFDLVGRDVDDADQHVLAVKQFEARSSARAN